MIRGENPPRLVMESYIERGDGCIVPGWWGYSVGDIPCGLLAMGYRTAPRWVSTLRVEGDVPGSHGDGPPGSWEEYRDSRIL